MFPPPVLEVDLDDICRDERPLVAGRSWLMVNMISTVDGVTDFDGVSGPLEFIDAGEPSEASILIKEFNASGELEVVDIIFGKI